MDNSRVTSLNKDIINMDENEIENKNINDYMKQLTPLQLKAYEIAKEHLKTSFDITRSNGFNEWVSKSTKK